MWCLSASGKRGQARIGAACALVFGLWCSVTASGQELPQILRSVENTHDAIASLDVRIAITDLNAKSSASPLPVTREERFAFKGSNRLFEKVDRRGKPNAGKHGFTMISLLGNHGFQQMTGRDFKVFGRRAKCPEAAFSGTTYGNAAGWEFPDPSIQNTQLRAMFAAPSLTSVLRDAHGTATTADGLVTLKGTIDCKAFEKELAKGPSAPPDTIAYEVVLDPAKAYAVVSRRIGSEDEFYHLRNFEFQEVVPGVWLPTRGECESRAKGKGITKETWKTTSLQVNNVDDGIFEEKLIPRSTYVDLDFGERDPKTGRVLVQRVVPRPTVRK